MVVVCKLEPMIFFGKLSRTGVVPKREDSLHNPSFLPLPTIITDISSATSECTLELPTNGGLRSSSKSSRFKAPKLLRTQFSPRFKRKSRPAPCHKINNQLEPEDKPSFTTLPGKHYS